MTHRIYLKPGEKIEDNLTVAERRNLLEDLMCLDPELEGTLDRIIGKIDRLLGTYTENEPPESLKLENTTKARARKATVAKRPRPVALLYQFKITLSDTKPPIWRRIQVEDCTLDKLHEHIQTAMGWTNSHLHHFKFDEL